MNRLLRKAVVAVALVTTSLGLVATSAGEATAGSADRRGSLGYTQVVVAPDVYALIASAGIAPAPVEGAKAFPFKGTLAARFPITGFRVAGLQIRHSGGISLSKDAASIVLKNFNIDLGRQRVSAEVSVASGSVGRVDVFKLRSSDRPDLGLVKLTLTSTAASALNATFGATAFAEDATFGYASPRPLGHGTWPPSGHVPCRDLVTAGGGVPDDLHPSDRFRFDRLLCF